MVKRLKGAALIAALAVATQVKATTPTLPDVGVDMPGLCQAGLTALGAVVIVVVGGYFAFLAIRLAMKWARRIA